MATNKIYRSVKSPEWDADSIGYCYELSDLYKLDCGTIYVENYGNLRYIPLAMSCDITLKMVDNPRLEFIRGLRGDYYRDLGIHRTALIGDEGMGHEWDGEKWLEFPQRGSVKIGEGVRVGAFTSIKKGALSGDFTEVGDGCKIGSHCNIGHGVKLGKNCLLTHRVSIAGSCEIGERVFFGQGCIIHQHIKIGDGAVIGQGANVLKDVPAGATVIGVWK